MILFVSIELVTDKSLKDTLRLDEFLQSYENGKNGEQYGIFKFVPTGYKYYPYEDGDLLYQPK